MIFYANLLNLHIKNTESKFYNKSINLGESILIQILRYRVGVTTLLLKNFLNTWKVGLCLIKPITIFPLIFFFNIISFITVLLLIYIHLSTGTNIWFVFAVLERLKEYISCTWDKCRDMIFTWADIGHDQ